MLLSVGDDQSLTYVNLANSTYFEALEKLCGRIEEADGEAQCIFN
jgi:hypothetical protein